jgi:hypothetical protein
LLKHIKTPGLNLEGVFKKVRIDLTEMRKSNPKLNMVPVEENKLTTEFFFVPANDPKIPQADTKPIEKSEAALYRKLPPHIVAIQLNTLTAEGTAMIRVNNTNILEIKGFRPVMYM